MGIHKAVIDQEQEIDAILSEIDIPEASYQKLLVLRRKVSAEVDAAVTGMQFQDMTNQLITRVIKRVDGLRASLKTLADHGEDMDPKHEHEEIVHLLEEMNISLNQRNDALKGGLIKSVGQQDMSSGDVELF